MDKDELNNLIIQISENFRLDVNLIHAFIATESGGVEWKSRFEPAWKYTINTREFADKLGISLFTETNQQSTSWGLMQVMGSVARELGFTSYLPQLCIPDIGIFYGCKKLRQLFDRYGEEEKVIASYNAGSPRMINGMYSNQKYVDTVYLNLRKLRSLN